MHKSESETRVIPAVLCESKWYDLTPLPPGPDSRMSKGNKMCRCYFLTFNSLFGEQFSQNVLDRSSPNFQDMGGYGQSDLFCENWHPSPAFCALAFHNGQTDCNMNTRFQIADDPSNLGPVTPKVCRRVCAE